MLAGVTGRGRPSHVYEDHLPGEADHKGGFMPDALWSLRPPGEHTSSPPPRQTSARAQERLAQAIREKLLQGYRLESQSETQAVLVKPPRRWLGITAQRAETREIVSIDRRGYPTVHTR